MSTSPLQARKTPGVYITEIDAFPKSIVGVATAVPAFLGYTQKATTGTNLPVALSSMAEFEQYFGTGPTLLYDVTATSGKQPSDIMLDGINYTVQPAVTSQHYLLYNSMQLFFANGGGSCYVVSVGLYGKGVALADLQAGLTAIGKQAGPTMLVAPDAVLLPSSGTYPNSSVKVSTDFNTFVHAMQQQCATLQDRMAIFDLYDTMAVTKANADLTLPACVGAFETAVSALNGSGLSYGAAYFPFLNTTVVAPTSLSAANLVLPLGSTFTAQDVQQLLVVVAQKENVLPSSAAIAGVYTANDQERGVWNAPANMVLASVTSPTVALTDVQQGGLNAPVNGLAVNVTRSFVNRGSVVWGARTLDGNSNDWRYIQVRRNIIYIEQSIKTALETFTFAPNTSTTWVAVTQMISSFLTNLWQQGGLMGDKASDAFTVQCGLGSTMNGQDLLEGQMVVQVTLQMVHPAEFIALTFVQKMQSA